MPRIHPKREILNGLLQLLPEVRGRLLRHLQSCPSCRQALEERVPAERGRLLPWRPSAGEAGRTVDLVLAGFRQRIQVAVRERDEAPSLLSELLRHRPERREMLVRNSQRFRNLPLCRLLLQRGYGETFDAPRQGERLAALALGLVDSLDPAWYGEPLLADARGRCWMIIANARRVASDLQGAEEAFQTAEAQLLAGTGDPLEKAQLLTYKACLRRTQRRLGEARAMFLRATSIFLSCQETHRVAESIVGLAMTERYRGESERALHLLETADTLVDPEEDPRFHSFIIFSRLVCLVEAGRPLEARGLLARSPELYREPGEVTQLRMSWLEARIAFGLGEMTRVVTLLTGVWKGFVRQASGYDAAAVALQLAVACGRLGRFRTVARLAGQAGLIFRSLGIERESLAAFIVLRQASGRTS